MTQGKGFGFGLGKMKELADALKKAQKVQEDALKMQQELDAMEIVGQDADGLVKVVLSGNQEPRRVEIAPAALEKTAEELSQRVYSALRAAYDESTATMKRKMDEITEGLGLPGG
ncbi:MAG: YbaB/EbfC family nucleoid-associated protein [Gloeomargarita sp. SKYBB_i_bin120]|nr:YbaB/EbfC family nucleoid-associated protein [Gloeomargarita sp. SKYG98]MCS7293565.1 YbaB/EbfC family nucleoid-associated protein [Gloeomargarita sp. SKYB120]MDW8179131.1 YbaB/EbfC family nucleoid-associated protein [Gloeomargarita sp. SKYBB_i_bin120]